MSVAKPLLTVTNLKKRPVSPEKSNGKKSKSNQP
jgi:hypothetical protein